MPHILAEFDEATQELLNMVDSACSGQLEILRGEAARASLSSKPLEVTVEDMAWLKVIKAYGILYNRAVDSGWLNGVITGDK